MSDTTENTQNPNDNLIVVKDELGNVVEQVFDAVPKMVDVPKLDDEKLAQLAQLKAEPVHVGRFKLKDGNRGTLTVDIEKLSQMHEVIKVHIAKVPAANNRFDVFVEYKQMKVRGEKPNAEQNDVQTTN